ncbi:MAG: hypothetical protein M1831_002961 [Alyxoria varia]|nr:MAG: hypothetical protein M1831_002961 [Alyxoria varia]
MEICICRAQKTTASPTSSTSAGPAPTCAVGSVNYITHTLPQQCLKTSWTASAASSVTSPTGEAPSSSTDEQTTSSTTTSNTVSGDSSSQDSAQAIPSASKTEGTSSNTTTSESASSTASPAEDAESPLDNAKFLSFEDWKKERLADSGQSAETIGQARGITSTRGERRRPGNVHNALDSLGEDSEIELDFSGFGGSRDSTTSTQNKSGGEENPEARKEYVPASGARSKDAGRTCKERFNYASFDCAANVLKTNPQLKNPPSILVENKDSYMLNECAADNKFVIVELCDHIQIDTVVLANFEFFSSMFRSFRLSVSDRYPVKMDRWRVLGTYEARNSREIQAFLVENPLIWARYLRIEFLTHYGSEFFCPMSLLRVHGTTMMEDYRHQEELARGEFDPREEYEAETQLPNDAANAISEKSHLETPASSSHADAKDNAESSKGTSLTPESSEAEKTISHQESPEVSSESATSSVPEMHPQSSTESHITSDAPSPSSPTSILHTSAETSSTTSISSMTSESSPQNSVTDATKATTSSASTSSSSIPNSLITTTSASSHSFNLSSSTSANATFSATQGSPSRNASNSSIPSSSVSSSPVSTPTPSQPATQESFFKSIHKRLQALEANATLSLQYIESQSQLLREAFQAVEKRQLAKTATFLENLNATVLAELTRTRADYDQLWQSTVLELANQREEGRREREVLGERVRMLADEVVGQKRLMAAQATLLLFCLGFVVFARLAPTEGVDAGLLQSVQSLVQRSRIGGIKSSTDLVGKRSWQWESPGPTPFHSRPGTSTREEFDKPLPPPPPADSQIQTHDHDSNNDDGLEIRRTASNDLPSPSTNESFARRRESGRGEGNATQIPLLQLPESSGMEAGGLRGTQSSPSLQMVGQHQMREIDGTSDVDDDELLDFGE